MSDSTEDFAALFEASIKAKRFKEGQALEGTIVAIGPEVAFVDVGGKGEAQIDVDELKDEEGDIEVSVGDRIQAVVVSVAGGLQLSRKLARGAATIRRLEDAFRAGLPVEGKVEQEIKGGYEVRVARQRAFCPYSQMDIVRTEPAMHLGKVYAFRITEFKEGGKNLIVSRRSLLEDEQRARAAEVRQSIVPGAIVTGRIVSVREFGAFVDLGGNIQGLLHVSEMGWGRVVDPSQVVKVGDEVTVKVLRVDAAEGDKQKIALGLKQLMDDPWSTVEEQYAAGRVYAGTVQRHEKFGVFVALAPGLTGMIPMNETGLPKSSDVPRALPVGATLQVMVTEIDPANRRMRLSMKAIDQAREADEVRQYTERIDAAPETFGSSLAAKLRGALKPKQDDETGS
jgi:small subunit ribosomal protein S1